MWISPPFLVFLATAKSEIRIYFSLAGAKHTKTAKGKKDTGFSNLETHG